MARGWLPWIEGPWLEPGEKGVPLYTPSRVGMLLRLQRDSVSDDERDAIAKREEWFIDEILTSDEWVYEDDDLLLLVGSSELQVLELEVELKREAKYQVRPPEQVEKELKLHRAFVCRYKGATLASLPLDTRNRLRMRAFELRFHQEMMRVQLLMWERQPCEMGFSPWVMFSRSSHSLEDGFDGDVAWRWTLEGLSEERDHLPIRVPGFVLRDGLVTPTRTLAPTEYKRLWDKWRLDEYLRARAELIDQRTCLHCHKPLPEEADKRKAYCGPNCQNAAKQKRFRRNRPLEVSRIQQRYWSSLDDSAG